MVEAGLSDDPSDDRLTALIVPFESTEEGNEGMGRGGQMKRRKGRGSGVGVNAVVVVEGEVVPSRAYEWPVQPLPTALSTSPLEGGWDGGARSRSQVDGANEDTASPSYDGLIIAQATVIDGDEGVGLKGPTLDEGREGGGKEDFRAVSGIRENNVIARGRGGGKGRGRRKVGRERGVWVRCEGMRDLCNAVVSVVDEEAMEGVHAEGNREGRRREVFAGFEEGHTVRGEREGRGWRRLGIVCKRGGGLRWGGGRRGGGREIKGVYSGSSQPRRDEGPRHSGAKERDTRAVRRMEGEKLT